MTYSKFYKSKSVWFIELVFENKEDCLHFTVNVIILKLNLGPNLCCVKFYADFNVKSEISDSLTLIWICSLYDLIFNPGSIGLRGKVK